MANEHSSASRPNFPKRQRVSAVRDFPPGCGRFAPLNVLRPNKVAVCVGTVGNFVDCEKNGDVSGNGSIRPPETVVKFESVRVQDVIMMNGEANHVQSKMHKQVCSFEQTNGIELVNVETLKDTRAVESAPVDASEHEALDSVRPPEKTVVDSVSVRVHDRIVMNGKANHVQSKTEEQATSFDQINGIESVYVEASNDTCGKPEQVEVLEPALNVAKEIRNVDAIAPIAEMVPRKYPPRRKISAVRDFPPFCGRSAPNLTKEECLEVLTSEEKERLGQVMSGIEQYLMEVTVKTDVKEVGDNVQVGDVQESSLGQHFSGTSVDNVQAEYDGSSITETGNKLEFENSSLLSMKPVQEDFQERSISLKKDIITQCNQNSEIVPKVGNDFEDLKKSLGQALVVYTGNKTSEKDLYEPSYSMIQMLEENFDCLVPDSKKEVVIGLMASTNYPAKRGEMNYKAKYSAGGPGEKKEKRSDSTSLQKPKPAFRKKKKVVENLKACMRKNLFSTGKDIECADQNIAWEVEDDLEQVTECDNFILVRRSHNFGVSVPPSVPSGSGRKADGSDAHVTRNKVRETLRLFQAVFRKLLQGKEAKPKEGGGRRRIDFQAAKILKEKGKYVNVGKPIIGSVPGVEIGDEFHYWVELNIIGLHRPSQAGIDFMKQGQDIIAISIVASVGYDDDTDNSDVLIYMGSGGKTGDNEPEDQKLERGNLALKNSMDAQSPVRVIRGDIKVSDSADARMRTYIYDGLYLVEKYWQDIGSHGKLVFKFRLVRVPGQPELAWQAVKSSKKFKVREGLCIDDISQGKEKIPICAVNTIDDEKPPRFEYVTRMISPKLLSLEPPVGCNCINGCSDFGTCSCVAKNGGEIPYNYNGAIVEAKPLVYECGPYCKCPPSCHNRVTQHGIKFQLEIFKTESRGWGVRSLNSIPSGSFVCEYAGELLEEKEAEQRTGNDEYLFDIGNDYNDSSLWDGLSTLMPEAHARCQEAVKAGSFTIDAAQYGNVGRFVNHSCSPNLYAQNVLYDHMDKRIPHIMLFAAENIPPLQELTYHYNYMIDQILDANGDIKKKKCYCGSSECTGRLY